MEGHARNFFIIRHYVAGKEAFRVATRDKRFDAETDFQDIEKLLSHVRIVVTGYDLKIAETFPSYGNSNEKYPMIEPIFGLSDFKDSPDNLDLLRQLSETMYGQGQDGKIPVGYTYLGQFVAHEICRSEQIAPGDATNGASFTVDLDSIYEKAPRNGLLLELGATSRNCGPFDIKREDDGRPSIGNGRNDVNLALSQIHCAIVRFHNSVAESGIFSSFDDIRTQVALSFQSILLKDWLPTLTSVELVDSILGGRRFTAPMATTLCPAEAVLAGFRFGHSMSRREYVRWNGTTGSAASINGLLRQTFAGGGLAEGRLGWDWPIDWRGFFAFDDSTLGMPPMVAKSIDTTLDDQLGRLDPYLFQIQPAENSLAYRTLWFGAAAGLQDGWTVQKLLADAVGPGEFAMRPPKLIENRSDLEELFGEGKKLAGRPPLWWFILREAELFSSNGGLCGVGARLVAETVVAAIEASSRSILKGEAIHRELPGGGAIQPTMANLLQWRGAPLNWYVEGQKYHC